MYWESRQARLPSREVASDHSSGPLSLPALGIRGGLRERRLAEYPAKARRGLVNALSSAGEAVGCDLSVRRTEQVGRPLQARSPQVVVRRSADGRLEPSAEVGAGQSRGGSQVRSKGPSEAASVTRPSRT